MVLKVINEDRIEEKNLEKLSCEKPASWYEKGLPFSCTGCGKCCTGSPGFVWVGPEEMEAIASFLRISLAAFTQNYVRKVKGRHSLIERPGNFDCIFLKEGKCEIYPVRPIQCQTYPWWPQNLKSEEDWIQAAHFCEGIQKTAPLTPVEEIKTKLALSQKIFN